MAKLVHWVYVYVCLTLIYRVVKDDYKQMSVNIKYKFYWSKTLFSIYYFESISSLKLRWFQNEFKTFKVVQHFHNEWGFLTWFCINKELIYAVIATVQHTLLKFTIAFIQTAMFAVNPFVMINIMINIIDISYLINVDIFNSHL